MPSPYTYKTGGALRLKGDGKTRKKKAKAPSAGRPASEVKAPSQPQSGASTHVRGTTKVEQQFEKVQREKLREEVRREARKSHVEKVKSFNTYLERLSDHHDMPKIGPG
ncbi:hypothetical protein MVES_001470 [Malassezia vespertilionis]|uniref:DUF1754-domain-containing protein n=1 Tax=Malassezia vespertilionis TaxID=2020962 RepID=A0A2N1JCV0_9BASI|nr:hypothetical protein MVES_001470 [Malassezia vespertilionis]